MDKPLGDAAWPAVWDVIVIGGGATGLGCALDAATRGLRVLLLEANKFGQGTSGRSSKLVHGGVRYLAQGQLGLVYQALRERALLYANAPGLVWPLAFVVPVFSWRHGLWYWLGLKLYQLLAGRHSLGPTQWLSPKKVLQHVPALASCQGLCGGVLYMDAQFDEAGLIAALAHTAKQHGAQLLEHTQLQSIQLGTNQHVVYAQNQALGSNLMLQAKVVINAAGPWVDAIRAKVHLATNLDSGPTPSSTQAFAASSRAAALKKPLLRLSQGAHVVLLKRFFEGNTALLVPRTPDGRVLFVLPWQGQVLVGTTETTVEQPHFNPQPSQAELNFLLQTVSPFLSAPASQADVLSAFAGLRPLLRAAVDAGGAGQGTQSLSREHCVLEEFPGFVTVAGGKWTTYRKMAQDTVDVVCARLGVNAPCVTHHLILQSKNDKN